MVRYDEYTKSLLRPLAYLIPIVEKSRRRFITQADFVFALFCTNAHQKSGPGQMSVQKSKFANSTGKLIRTDQNVPDYGNLFVSYYHSIAARQFQKDKIPKIMYFCLRFSYRKASYMKKLAQQCVDCVLKDEELRKMTDKEVMRAVGMVKGIGEWSCHMFMMFQLGRPDVLPVGDLAIRKAFKRLYSLKDESDHQTAVAELPSAATLLQVSESWRPFRTVGSWYRWHVVETKKAAYTFGL
jgi:hypothetical protein